MRIPAITVAPLMGKVQVSAATETTKLELRLEELLIH
jgi:hypothetical protein